MLKDSNQIDNMMRYCDVQKYHLSTILVLSNDMISKANVSTPTYQLICVATMLKDMVRSHPNEVCG